MRFRVILLTALCLAPSAASSQDRVSPSAMLSASAATSLQITAEAKTPFAGGLAGRAKCDGQGNIYFRPTDAETPRKYHPISALPIRKLRSDGTLAGSFSLADAAPGLLAIDFFVTADGTVYQAARSESDHAAYVVSYSPDGALQSKVRLDGDFFIPYQIAVFKSGEVLISGINGPYNRTPSTAVYGANGKMIREIYEPEDEDARKRAQAGEPGFRPDNIDSSNDFVVRGDAALGSDGNVYLLRAASPALIFVISPKGEVVRKLRIEPPESGLWAGRLKSAPGTLAISFLQKGTNVGVIEVVDYLGSPTGIYAASDARIYAGLLGCYSPKRFTFLSLAAGDGLHLNTAEPK
jgi:hypothetical protein